MIMCMLLLFVCLFSLAFIFMSEKVEKSKKVDSKAEFLINLEWSPASESDVDIYIEDPLGNICYFNAREFGLIHLERDDRGYFNDKVYLSDGSEYIVRDNKETITLRGILPGEYVVNVCIYLKNEGEDVIPVKVELVKINPFVRTLMVKNIELVDEGFDKTAFRFTLNEQGEVTDINDLQKSFFGRVKTSVDFGPPDED